MFEAKLPRQINVLQLAEQHVTLVGELPFSKMTRLAPSLISDSGVVVFELNFGIDEEGIRYIKGNITAELALECQRCLYPMKYTINDTLMLGVVLSNNQAHHLAKHYAPLLVENEVQELLPIIEDELIVRLPIAASHSNTDCQLKLVEQEIKTDKKRNPFAELSKLKS